MKGDDIGMGLTERHWFENEDVPENYEWALEDAVYNSRATEKGGKMGMTDKDIIKAELQNLQSVLEDQAEMSIGSGKMRLLSFAHVCSGALELLKEKPITNTGHGRWIDTGSGVQCSICNEIQYGYDSGRFYCANCGAKMDLENKDENC